MSVIVTVKLPGDTEAFKQSLKDRADEYRATASRAKEHGALHHQFAVGDGFVLISDEWESADKFESFFSDPALREFIGSVSGSMNAAPEITVGESIDSPDKF